MTTLTCTVCGAAEEPGRDHTCPVCGADLPDAPAPSEEPEPFGPSEAAVPPEAAEPPEASEPPEAAGPPEASEPSHARPQDGAVPPPPSWPATSGPVPPPPPGGGSAGAGAAGPGPAASPYDPSHPSGLSSSVRTYGMLTHLSAFLGAMVALAFVGPLVMWLIRRDEHPFIDHHGKEALNFNLSMLLYLVIGFVASIATVGLGLVIVIPAGAVFFVTWVVVTIIAAVKANAGEGYRYPLSIRFVQD